MAIPQGANQRWSLDFVLDSLSCGRRFRILCLIDDFSRECQATVVDTSLSGVRVARELIRLPRREAIPTWWSVITSYARNISETWHQVDVTSSVC